MLPQWLSSSSHSKGNPIGHLSTDNQSHWLSWHRKFTVIRYPGTGKSTLLAILVKEITLIGYPGTGKSTSFVILAQENHPHWLPLVQENQPH